jgi:hypothetical protein
VSRSGYDVTAICHTWPPHVRTRNAGGEDACQVYSFAIAQNYNDLKRILMTGQHQDMSTIPVVAAFFDQMTNTISYAVTDPDSNVYAVVDSVMDIHYAAGRITHDNADDVVDYIVSNNLTLE